MIVRSLNVERHLLGDEISEKKNSKIFKFFIINFYTLGGVNLCYMVDHSTRPFNVVKHSVSFNVDIGLKMSPFILCKHIFSLYKYTLRRKNDLFCLFVDRYESRIYYRDKRQLFISVTLNFTDTIYYYSDVYKNI